MAELTAFCEAREHARLEVQQHRDGIRIQIDNAYDGRRYGPTDLTIKIPVPKPPRTATITLHPEGRPTVFAHLPPELPRVGVKGKSRVSQIFISLPSRTER